MGFLRRRQLKLESPPGFGFNESSPEPERDFGAVYDRYFPAVYGYCLSQLGDPDAAEDAASQTFLKALAAAPDYREMGRFRSWLFCIAHNVVLDARRSHGTDQELAAAAELPDPAASPEERTLAAVDAAWLDAAIARLSTADRQVIELRRAGLTGREIAAVLGIGHEAAKKRQLRAIERVRLELDGEAGREARRDA